MVMARSVRRIVMIVRVPVLMPGIGRIRVRDPGSVSMAVIYIQVRLGKLRLDQGAQEHQPCEYGRAREIHRINLGQFSRDSKGQPSAW